MPIRTQSDLPAKEILENENIFVMDEFRAMHQDIRPLQVLILNNMPIKQDTELQLLRALSNTPLQVDVTFMNVQSHVSLNTPQIFAFLSLFKFFPSASRHQPTWIYSDSFLICSFNLRFMYT